DIVSRQPSSHYLLLSRPRHNAPLRRVNHSKQRRGTTAQAVTASCLVSCLPRWMRAPSVSPAWSRRFVPGLGCEASLTRQAASPTLAACPVILSPVGLARAASQRAWHRVAWLW